MGSPPGVNYYKILGVAENAGKDDIKRAYRTRAKVCHPDKNPSPQAHFLFLKVNEAYEILMDDRKRRFYDLYRRNPNKIRSYRRNPRPTYETRQNEYYSRYHYRSHDYAKWAQRKYQQTGFYKKASRISDVLFLLVIGTGFGFLILPLVMDVPGGWVYNFVFTTLCMILGTGFVLSGYGGLKS